MTTGNYLILDSPCTDKQSEVVLLPIKISNGNIILSTHTALLKIDTLLMEARRAHIFSGLNKAVLSISTFCDHGCNAIFNKKGVTIKNKVDGTTIMQGDRD